MSTATDPQPQSDRRDVREQTSSVANPRRTRRP